MMTVLPVRPPSTPPALEGEDIQDHVEAMARWFELNFEGLINVDLHSKRWPKLREVSFPLFDPRAELLQAFPQASADEIEAAAQRVQRHATTDWTASTLRIDHFEIRFILDYVHRRGDDPVEAALEDFLGTDRTTASASSGKPVGMAFLLFLTAVLLVVLAWGLF